MCHRFEIYTDAQTAEGIITMADNLQIGARIIGHTEACDGRKLTISGAYGTFTY